MRPLRTLLVALFLPLAAAQSPTSPTASGVWLGTLAAGPQTLRIQLHLQPDITGPGACVLDSIDQKAFGIPCQLTVAASHVEVKVPAVNGGWTGTLSPDGNTLTGTWTQGTPLPLNLARQQTAIPPPATPKAALEPALPPVSLASLKAVLDKDLAPTLDHGALAPATHTGLAIGVVQHGQRQILTYGPAKPDSLFEIGSVTKTFTGLILAQMAQQGLVTLDTPVRELLPRGTVAKPAAGAEITLLDLSDQHSGLPRLPGNLHPTDARNPYADYDTKLLYGFVGIQGVALPPDAPFGYSNLGVGLLGQALANRANLPYPDLLQRQITGPLGMHDTAIVLTPALRARLIQGYDADGKPAPPWDLTALAGAGGIRSTAGDMLTYLEAQLHPDRLPASAAASPEGKTLAQAIQASHILHDSAFPETHIALNWIRSDTTGSFGHNGITGGYSSIALFYPHEDFAVVVLSNTTQSPNSITDALGYHIAQRLEGKPAVSLAPQS